MPRLTTLVPPPLRPLARRMREAFRRKENNPIDILLGPEALRGSIEPAIASARLQQGSATPCRVVIRNLGTGTWSSHGRYPLSLQIRWLSSRRDPIDTPVASFPLPQPVLPGKSSEIAATLSAPDFLGHFLVDVDLVQAGGSSVGIHNPRPVLIEAQVTGRDSDDIDYHKVYATADLSKDYWTVVGPSTQEEFHRLGQVKVEQLRQVGLTPDSRVLDVGCGTGQLADPLADFLSDRGSYHGVDIGPEAIAYCRQRYTRPNFHFDQNEMTTIPISDHEFDIISFFSVFTHTYPDETVLLLSEARRLLAPDGVILGDAFTSPMVDRCSGNRGAIELNRDHFLRLVDLARMEAEAVAGWPWQRYGRREVFRFTRRIR